MHRKSTLLLVVPVLLGACHGTFISLQAATKVYENIKELISEEEFAPELHKFTSIRRRLTSPSTDYIEYQKTVFDDTKYFYSSYTITPSSEGTSTYEKWWYRYMEDDKIYLVYFSKYNGEIYFQPTKENSYCENEDVFLEKWVEGPLKSVNTVATSDLKLATERVGKYIEEVDSDEVTTNVNFLSNNDESIYLNGTSKESTLIGLNYQREATIDIEDLCLVEFKYEEKIKGSDNESIGTMYDYTYQFDKAFVTYPDVTLPVM